MSQGGVSCTVSGQNIILNGTAMIPFNIILYPNLRIDDFSFTENIPLQIGLPYYLSISVLNGYCNTTIFPWIRDNQGNVIRNGVGEFIPLSMLNGCIGINILAGTNFNNYVVNIHLEQNDHETIESPSPDYPAPISGVEYIEKWEGMSAENRNQCAPNYFKRQEWYGYIMSDGTIYPNDTLDLHSDYIHINPEYGEMQFTIFEFATHGNPIVGFYQSDKTYISRTSLPSTGTAPLVTSIPIPSNAAYVRFCIVNPNYYGGKYKVEFGTVATDYSVAPEDLPSYQKIMLPQPLYNLPNGAADSYEVIGATGTEKIKKVILDGSKIGNNYWVYSNSENDTSICYGAPSGVLNGRLAGIGNSYCDKFQYAGESSNWQHGDMRESYWPHTSQSDYLLIRINKSRLSGWSDSWTNAEKVEAFKTWLSSNPVTILYELAVPQTIAGTPQELKTIVGQNVIVNDNNGQMTVSWYNSVQTPFTFNFVNNSDDEDIMRPKLQFTCGSIGGTVSITNVTDNNNIIQFTGLIAGEIISIDEFGQLSSSTGLSRYDNWNQSRLYMLSGLNQLNVTGDIIKIIITYQNVRRVGY